jgi:ribosomal protein L2
VAPRQGVAMNPIDHPHGGGNQQQISPVPSESDRPAAGSKAGQVPPAGVLAVLGLSVWTRF